jgi:hypothetical protein
METLVEIVVFSVLGGFAGACLSDYLGHERDWRKVEWKFNVLVGIAAGLTNTAIIEIFRRLLSAFE